MPLRNYQTELKQQIMGQLLNGRRAICAVSPTGSGKTVLMADLAVEFGAGTCLVAHRHELVGQISKALCEIGLHHRVIGSRQTQSFCVSQSVIITGKNFIFDHAHVAVVSVDTLIARHERLRQWCADIKYWMIDECHHVLPDNKWGRALSFMPNARGVGFTATPLRADNKSLSATQTGTFDALCVGPSMRELIDQDYLCDYRIFVPPQSFDVSSIRVSRQTGDYVPAHLRQVSHASSIVGDVVEHYMRLANGKRGITFTVDVESAVEMADRYNAVGIPAAAVSAKTPDTVRAEVIKKFRNGDLLQLTNVDLFGEGFDVPAVEVVSMARPTQSYGLYVQQFGRALRLLEGKTHGIIIDHVNNVIRHGLPDTPREWSLETTRRGTASENDIQDIPLVSCTECFQPFERIHTVCPHCGHDLAEDNEGRARPDVTDGELIELDDQMLAELRGEIDRIDGPVRVPPGLPEPARVALERRWVERQEHQEDLRDDIALWAGYRKSLGENDDVIHRRFFYRFGTTITRAQTFSAKDAQELSENIKRNFWKA